MKKALSIMPKSSIQQFPVYKNFPLERICIMKQDIFSLRIINKVAETYDPATFGGVEMIEEKMIKKY